MNLSKKLKSWACAEKLAKADDSDDTFKKAIAGALVDGKLTAEKYKELSATEDDDSASGMKAILQQLGGAIGELKTMLAPAAKVDKAAEKSVDDDGEDDEDDKSEKSKKAADKTPKTKVVQSSLEKMLVSLSPSYVSGDLNDGDEKSFTVRVKEAADSYSQEKSIARYPEKTTKGFAHPLAGQTMKLHTDDRPMDTPSDLAKAVSGAWGKFLVQTARSGLKSTAFASLPQHDKELILYAMENMEWGGTTEKDAEHGGDENIKHRKLTLREQKALIDDSTSGGLEAAPIVFDDQAITTPLLNGELFPLVHTIPIDRGRRVEGVAISNVTGSWGGIDDTSVSLFNTAAFVTAFDTTIFRWEGAIQIGLDFMSDTPLNFGQIITEQYGQRLLEDLDDVIATGNGTTQPEGVTVKSGTTSVNFGSAAATLAGYESLRFGVAKPEHKSAMASAVFCGSETSYQRAKAIPVGASDTRRLSQTVSMPNYDDYSWMGRPFKINESLGNTKIFYTILNRYRMYRRRGLTMRQSSEGDTLLRKNELLLVAMARYGGHLTRGVCAAVTSTAQA